MRSIGMSPPAFPCFLSNISTCFRCFHTKAPKIIERNVKTDEDPFVNRLKGMNHYKYNLVGKYKPFGHPSYLKSFRSYFQHTLAGSFGISLRTQILSKIAPKITGPGMDTKILPISSYRDSEKALSRGSTELKE